MVGTSRRCRGVMPSRRLSVMATRTGVTSKRFHQKEQRSGALAVMLSLRKFSGFEADRDENASYNVLKLGLDELGIEYELDGVVGLGEAESTPAETALPTGADVNDNSSFRVVPAKRVVETGSHGSPDPW